MVDFRKRLAKARLEKPVDPEEIYDRLDRASDKGPLRPAQRAVLAEWHSRRRNDKDTILKLHTGQGKTLIGLLLLQSKLNEKEGRALYLCPNNFLVRQTLEQAQEFGIAAIPPNEDGELPPEFLNGRAILVTSVQKLFNGLTKFRLGAHSLDVDYIVLDDAHACIDSIKEACMITLPRDHPAYPALQQLFAVDLEGQGVGTFADIQLGKSGSFLPVPYWAWMDRHADAANILARHTESKAILFAWPILRDILHDCLCLVSGREIVIAPYLPPLERFGSYENARLRVFMSATVTDDSFLIKGLGLQPEVIKNPLVYKREKWSGEKMVLIPSLIDESLTDTEIVHTFAKPVKKRRYGIVVLVPGFEAAKDWSAAGAMVATKGDIDERVDELRVGSRDTTLVVANRYDGIDLPDDACRILILDGKPQGEALIDRYLEESRPGSALIASRTSRIVEQGLGRAVRGEKDYCVVLLTGADLVKTVRAKESLGFFSQQTKTQIELGMEVAEYAKEEIPKGRSPTDTLRTLVLQCLNRDDGWKEFYVERMDSVDEIGTKPKMLEVFSAERESELKYRDGEVDRAVQILQELLDNDALIREVDRGWYLQEMARFTYADNKTRSNKLQNSAHSKNRYLLKPRSGSSVSKLEPLSQKRVAAVIDWIAKFSSFEDMTVAVDAILSALNFGVRAEPFESAFAALGVALGFNSERPDKEWKAGPDNLWALRPGEYLLVECKSEVEVTRESINKGETGQMNNACSWFDREYPGAQVTRIMIIPTKRISAAAGFNHDVSVLRKAGLTRLTRNTRKFFDAFRGLDLQDLSEKKVQTLLTSHDLRIEDLASYADTPRYA